MKNILYILLFLLVVTSCGRGKSDNQEAAVRDSLEQIIADKDAAINDIFSSLNSVTENLNTIKSREKIITSNLNNGEIPKQQTVQITEDIEAINQLLVKNRETIARLNATAEKLKKANIKITGLEQLIAQLNQQVESQNREIESLRLSLDKSQQRVADLTDKVSGLSSQVTGLSEDKASLEGEVKNKTDILNTGYYMIGSEKELLSKEIVYKSGFIGRTLKINENRSLDSFTQVDIRNFSEVLINHKKATLISSHPAGSYEFRTNSDGVFESLVITDKGKFWEYSKVLVISYK